MGSTLWGSQFLLNTTTTDSQQSQSITALRDGSFVAVWQDDSKTGGDTSGSAIRGQLFNADGSKRGGEFLVNTATDDFQVMPQVTVLNDGRFVVTWGGAIRARVQRRHQSSSFQCQRNICRR